MSIWFRIEKNAVFLYNIHMMNQELFKNEEEEVLSKITSSSYFRRAKDLSEQISSVPELIALSKKRDDAYVVAATTDDENLRREKEIEAKKANDELLSFDIVKEYMENYLTIKELLNKINDEILKELRYD